MAQFVTIQTRTLNVEYIRHYQQMPDGSITVHMDQEAAPLIVPAEEARVFLAAVVPVVPAAAKPATPATLQAGLKEQGPAKG